jgi:hypothetical protein
MMTVLDTVFMPLLLMGYLDLDILEFIPAKAEHGGEMTIIFKKNLHRLPVDPIDLISFYESDFGTGIEILKQELRRLENEKREFLQSNSWKITSPLRKIAQLLRKSNPF